ncbi:protein phosphatase 2c, putative [Ichthyophthirius multifiliis]|uniref:Protein phosphatase 2c, putative n=1 Tax=Ichthyophthirius multifiliis TaxID=5932 RepID=G0QTY0_ICHMU|nr:protein phosphatase 2c, putative [Ichthyophthirius multifiliis]EGR31339.1 protein phosphatase 2c, putative [Ichthyophthirius multifiliis]|eukprot:XP_004034825.1 protein phosphatase 2c, putative [Ichthyophthirius multifiliis]
MEDGFFINDNFLADGGKSILFAVMDGHGGKDVVEYVKQNFSRVDQLLKQNCRSQDIGSTACIGFIRLEEAKRVLYISNVGDTSAVLIGENSAQMITVEHKASNPREIDRIKFFFQINNLILIIFKQRKSGGNVIYDRVAGVLAVSRAFGDHGLSNFGVICLPDCNRIELRIIHKYLVLASDGLWDVVQPKEVLEVSKIKSNCEEIAAELIKRALNNGSRDNITIMVLKLN